LVRHRLHSGSIGRENSEAQHNFYLQSIFELINKNYIDLSWGDLLKRDEARNQKTRKLKDLLAALRIDERVYLAYLDKEGPAKEIERQVTHLYQRKRLQMIKGYLKNKMPRIYAALKN